VKALIPSYNRYSHHARRALTHAGLLVTRLRHPFADTGHLLVGVMQTQGSIGGQILQELELDIEVAVAYLQTLSPALAKPVVEIRNADEFNAALTFAADEAAWLGHHYIGTEHLLLGITRANVGNAREMLRHLGISPEQVRRRVRRLVNDGVRELDLQVAKRSARLTELSRRTITTAEQSAVLLDHATVGLGHLLLEMLLEERSPISTLLRESGLEESALRERLERGDAALLVSLEGVLNWALDQAESLGSHYTGTEHLLLTLTADENGSALLESFSIDAEDLRERVRAHLLTQLSKNSDIPE
jgi:ATP-dependent Clp protease ATP-binding subunit ClpA